MNMLSNFTPPTAELELTDMAAAQQFATIFADKLRYNHDTKAWLVWDSGRWSPDGNGSTQRLAKQLVLEYLDAATSAIAAGKTEFAMALQRFAVKLSNGNGPTNVLKHAQSDASLALEGDELDTHARLLNVSNGTIELGNDANNPGHFFRAADPSDLLTRQAAVTYDPAANAPKFEQFIDQTFGGDTSLIDFVRRLCGYCLFAGNPDQVVVICHGEGKNGKSTLLNLLTRLLGGYGQTLSDGALHKKVPGGLTNDVYDMQSIRLATAPDLSKSAIDQSLIKRLSGGDNLRARPLYGNNVEFKIDATIFISANEKPQLDAGDAAIWRRVVLVPFLHVVPESNRNPKLPEELLDEASGILNWMLAGHADYTVNGLNAPATVTTATQTYRDEADIVKRFIEEECQSNPGLKQPAGELQREFSRWCRENSEVPISSVRLKERLEKLGHSRVHVAGGNVYKGLAWQPANVQDQAA